MTIHIPGIATMSGVVVESVPGASEIALPRRRPIEARYLHRQPALLVSTGADERVSGTLLAYEAEQGGLREDRMQFLHETLGVPPEHEDPEQRAAAWAAMPLSRLDDELAEVLAEQSSTHFLRDDRPGTKRRGARVQLIRPVAIVPESFKQGWLNGAIRDVSIGGVLIAGADRFQEGDRLRLRFELDHEDDVIDLTGRIVRDNDPWGLRGLRIERTSDRERDRLIRYIYESQREQVKRRAAMLSQREPVRHPGA